MFRDNMGMPDRNRMNSASVEGVNVSEFAAIFTIGSVIAFFWHLFTWNGATRQVATAVLMGSVTVQLVAVAYYVSTQNNYDHPIGESEELAPVVVQAGVAAIISFVLSLVAVLLSQLLSLNLAPASVSASHGACPFQTDCCVSTSFMCFPDVYCSFGRFLTLAISGLYLSLVVIRGALAAELMNDYITSFEDRSLGSPNGNKFAFYLTINVIIGTGIVFGASLVQVFHGLLSWTVVSMNNALVAGVICVAFETWMFGYTIAFWQEGTDTILATPMNNFTTENAQNKRFDTIASLTLIAFLLQFAVLLSNWFFTSHLAPYGAEKGCRYCVSRSSRFAAVVVLSLAVISFGLYVARGAVAGKVLVDEYDREEEQYTGRVSQATPIRKNSATGFLTSANNINVGIGYGLVAFALNHLFFWNRFSANALIAAGFITFGLDLVSLGYASKQQKIDDDRPDNQAVNKHFKSTSSLALISPWINAALVLATYLFTCGFTDVESGSVSVQQDALGGESGETATETETSGVTSGETSGETSGATSGVSGEASGATSGATSGVTSGEASEALSA